jgi:hypothetical protein
MLGYQIPEEKLLLWFLSRFLLFLLFVVFAHNVTSLDIQGSSCLGRRRILRGLRREVCTEKTRVFICDLNGYKHI